MFLQTVYNTCTHSVTFTTEILRKSDVSGWCHFEIGVVPLNSIHVIIEYVNSTRTSRLHHCTAASGPLTINTGGCAGRKWRPMHGIVLFAENRYFCWIGRVLGWEECVPNFHK